MPETPTTAGSAPTGPAAAVGPDHPALFDVVEHTIDAKGRTMLPPGARTVYPDGGVLTVWSGPCIAVFTHDGFAAWRNQIRHKIAAAGFDDPAGHIRHVSARSAQFRPDAQGRFAVPDRMRSRCGIDRDVCLVGVGDRLEIWDRQRYGEGIDEFEDNILFLQATHDLPDPVLSDPGWRT